MPQATVFKFSEEFRPVPLTSHIVTGDAMNDFALGVKFDKDLWGVVNRYGSGKPTLIFCPTRKSCSAAAEQLYKDYGAAQNSGMGLPWHPRKK
jgi:ATP-dependent DNA helicase HFM1/MER3